MTVDRNMDAANSGLVDHAQAERVLQLVYEYLLDPVERNFQGILISMKAPEDVFKAIKISWRDSALQRNLQELTGEKNNKKWIEFFHSFVFKLDPKAETKSAQALWKLTPFHNCVYVEAVQNNGKLSVNKSMLEAQLQLWLTFHGISVEEGAVIALCKDVRGCYWVAGK